MFLLWFAPRFFSHVETEMSVLTFYIFHTFAVNGSSNPVHSRRTDCITVKGERTHR